MRGPYSISKPSCYSGKIKRQEQLPFAEEKANVKTFSTCAKVLGYIAALLQLEVLVGSKLCLGVCT